MAVSLFQKIVNRMFKEFTLRMGREPMTPSEWMSIQNSAVNYLNKTKGVPPGPKKSPFQGFTPKVIPGGKGIEDLLKTGDVQKGVAPKTKPRPEGLDVKTQQDVIKENWAAKQKQKNKEAIERFKQKTKKKTVEDFRDEGDFDPGGMATGGLAYMLGEPNTRTEALQEFGVVTDPWGMYTDPSLYAKGERSKGVPARAEYKEGGGGQGPWTVGQGARTPDQEQNLDTPQPQVMGTPNPLQMPQGIPSVAPKSMDPRVMQQQMMQRAMMGQQQMMGQQPRMGYASGGMGRRAFMKMLAGLTALPFIGKGLTKKAAAPVVKAAETVIERGADGIPKYVYDLIEVVKAKGTRDIIEGFKRSDYSTVHRYKGVEVIEDANGATRIIKPTEGVATDSYTGKMHEGTSQEVHIEISPQYIEQSDPESGLSWYVNEKGRKVYETKIPDEYFEGTVYPDMDGKMKDVVEEIDEVDHLDLKKIADEIDTLVIKKASGGLAYMLGE